MEIKEEKFEDNPNNDYTYLVYQKDYDTSRIIFSTKDFEKIKNLIKEDKFDFINPDKFYSQIVIEKFKVNNNDNKKNTKLTIELKSKSILDKDKEIIYNFDNDNLEDLIEKKNKLVKLLKEATNLYHNKKIPDSINNYFHIIYEIENLKDNKNLEENIDYLEVVIEEMKTYPDKEKKLNF